MLECNPLNWKQQLLVVFEACGTITIGKAVSGGNPDSVLYVDSSGDAANDTDFVYDGAFLGVGTDTPTAIAHFKSRAVGEVTIKGEGFAGQTADLMQLLVDGTLKVNVEPSGIIEQQDLGDSVIIGIDAFASHDLAANSRCVAIGVNAGTNTTTADGVTVVGYDSGQGNTGNNFLTAFGYQAYSTGNGGANSTAIGAFALMVATANDSIALGYKAADNLTTGVRTIHIGWDIDAQSPTAANVLNIGNLIFGTGIDGTGTTLSSGDIGIGVVAPASKLDVEGLITGSDTVLLASRTTLSSNAGAGAGTLTNAPTAGDPTKWIEIDDNGTPRYIPTWT